MCCCWRKTEQVQVGEDLAENVADDGAYIDFLHVRIPIALMYPQTLQRRCLHGNPGVLGILALPCGWKVQSCQKEDNRGRRPGSFRI